MQAGRWVAGWLGPASPSGGGLRAWRRVAWDASCRGGEDGGGGGDDRPPRRSNRKREASPVKGSAGLTEPEPPSCKRKRSEPEGGRGEGQAGLAEEMSSQLANITTCSGELEGGVRNGRAGIDPWGLGHAKEGAFFRVCRLSG